MAKIVAKHGHYIVEDVEEIPSRFRWELGVYNRAYHRWEYIGLFHHKTKKELRIPRGYSDVALQNSFPDHTFVVDRDGYYPYDTIDINLTAPPRDYMQEDILTFMIGKKPYEYTSGYSQIYSDMDTGSGKTYCGIATICYFRCRAVIFIPSSNSRIGEQWRDAALNFTTLKKDEVLIVRGSKVCKDIIRGKYENIKVFIVPRSTILSFVKQYDDNWEMVDLLIRKMNVGIKIVDEAHMDFDTMVNIECFTNVKRNFYMSSSPSRSDRDEKSVYSKLFKNVPRRGKELKSLMQNHIITLIINFSSTPTKEQVRAIKTVHGPSAAKYGDYLLSDDGARDEFLEAYLFSVYWLMRFRRESGKLMVLCVTKHFAKELAQFTKGAFPHYSVGLYIGSGKDKEKELENDIIFSTVKSAGTGVDIKNLQFIINTITYSSDVLADQICGRLRKRETGKSIYCELVNIAHPVARKHYKQREPILKRKSKDGVIIAHQVTYQNVKEMDSFFSNGFWFDSEGRLRDRSGRYVVQRTDRSNGK